MGFDLELGIQPVGSAGFLGVDLLHPSFIAAKADVLAAHRTAIDPQRRFGQAGQEGPVVADDHESALVAAEPVFQPIDCGDVEVVGRLVEQQQVGLRSQRAGEGCAAAFPAAGAVRRAAHVDAELPGDRFDFMARWSVRPRQREIHQRIVAGEERILLKHHDPGAGLDRALALVRLDLARDQPQHGGLARAVATDQGQPITRADRQAEIAEQPA